MRMLGLMHIQDFRNILVDILSSINRTAQFQDGLSCHQRLFVVILDFDVDHMDRSVEFAVPSQEVWKRTNVSPVLAYFFYFLRLTHPHKPNQNTSLHR